MPEFLPDKIRDSAACLWHYHRLDQVIDPAEGILVFGSNDLRVAGHASDLFHRGFGPWILFSGNRGRLTEHWSETEAEAMARTARNCGVPPEAIFIEANATNTGENIRFSRALLDSRGLRPQRLIVVQKPYMERRTFAALEVQWPGVRFQVDSPPLRFEDYFTENLTPRVVIEAMTGDFQRILDYPAKGFASVQPVTKEVMTAYDTLVAAGYGKPTT